MNVLRSPHSRLRQIVSILEPSRNKWNWLRAKLTEHTGENCRRTDPVDIVVAVNHHGLALRDRLHETIDCLVRALHEQCVMQLLATRAQKAHCFVRIRVLPDYKKVGDFVGNAQLLGKRPNSIGIWLLRDDPSRRTSTRNGNFNRCCGAHSRNLTAVTLSLIHISEPTRLLSISYAVFCLK